MSLDSTSVILIHLGEDSLGLSYSWFTSFRLDIVYLWPVISDSNFFCTVFFFLFPWNSSHTTIRQFGFVLCITFRVFCCLTCFTLFLRSDHFFWLQFIDSFLCHLHSAVVTMEFLCFVFFCTKFPFAFLCNLYFFETLSFSFKGIFPILQHFYCRSFKVTRQCI